MKADVLLGLQWGDEGKGKIVDVLAPQYDIVARFQGGPNAGHTLEFNGLKYVLHIIPSGIFHRHIINIIGNGVVIDPIVFREEVLALEKLGVNCKENLLISNRSHLILPTHRLLDAASESAKGKEKIGSTLRGIGPAYMDKTGRNGLRTGDIFSDDFKQKYDFLIDKHKQLLELYELGDRKTNSKSQTPNLEPQTPNSKLNELEEKWFEGIETIKKFRVIASELFLNDALARKKKILAEGAQGSLLDIDFGSYPYVTSSNTICAGACTGLGIPPSKIGEVIGVFKAYCTRVGSGPFPTELTDETGKHIRQTGKEFGATTGRPRRCGWLDIPALNYAVMLNGVTRLVMMKTDVLSGMETVKVCTHYTVRGKNTDGRWEKKNQIDFPPYDISSTSLMPVYKEFAGWKIEQKKILSGKIPQALQQYLSFIEQEVKTPVSMISFGPDRMATWEPEQRKAKTRIFAKP